jgi:peptidyl-prolyl cis-trans isomerase C
MNHFYIALSLALILTPSLAVNGAERKAEKGAAPAVTASTVFGDKVIARGKGFEVKQSQVDDMFITFKSNKAAMGERVPEAMRPRIEADILEKLIATHLFLNMATEADKAKGKETAALFIAEQMKQMPSEESFNRQLISLGMAPEKFRAQILEQAIVQAVIERELRTKATVTEAQMKEFYDKNPTYFQEPELVRVRHVLISTKDPATGQELPPEKKAEKHKAAQKVLTRAKAGEDFVWLAKEFSEDAASKNKGGEYVIARAKDDPSRGVVPEFEGAAFSLATNKVSEIVTTKYGYHVIKVIEKIPVKKIEYEKVEAKIKETLMKEEVQKHLPDYVAKLKKDAGVEILVAAEKK